MFWKLTDGRGDAKTMSANDVRGTVHLAAGTCAVSYKPRCLQPREKSQADGSMTPDIVDTSEMAPMPASNCLPYHSNPNPSSGHFFEDIVGT